MRWPHRGHMQRHTSHYAAYDRYWEEVTPRIVDRFRKYLETGRITELSTRSG